MFSNMSSACYIVVLSTASACSINAGVQKLLVPVGTQITTRSTCCSIHFSQSIIQYAAWGSGQAVPTKALNCTIRSETLLFVYLVPGTAKGIGGIGIKTLVSTCACALRVANLLRGLGVSSAVVGAVPTTGGATGATA